MIRLQHTLLRRHEFPPVLVPLRRRRFGRARLITLILVAILQLPMRAAFGQSEEAVSSRARQSEDEQILKDRLRSIQYRDRLSDDIRQGKNLVSAYDQPLLSQPVDAQAYVLGPGDALHLALWGDLEAGYTIPVLPEGTISIPTIGVIEIAGKTLAEARDRLKTAVASSYRNVTFTLDLVQLRRFRVYVTGQVAKPGTYFAQEQDRVSDIIELAGGPVEWADMRRVEVRHADQSTAVLDLQRFYATGSFADNLPLQSGDMICVVPIDPSHDYVIVESDLESNGVHPIRPGETLLSFLQTNRALSRRADLRNIRIVRENRLLSHDLLASGNGIAGIELKSGDRISLVLIQDEVFVEGYVLRPGPQAYFPNVKAIEYANNAGRTSESGSADKIKVIRASTGKEERGKDVIVERGDRVIVAGTSKENLKDIFQIFSSAASLIVSFAVIQSLNK